MSEEEFASQMAGGAVARDIEEAGLDRGLRLGEELAAPKNDGRASTSILRDDEVEASRSSFEAEKLLERLGLLKAAALHRGQRGVIHATARGRRGGLIEALLSRKSQVEVGMHRFQKNRRHPNDSAGAGGGRY